MKSIFKALILLFIVLSFSLFFKNNIFAASPTPPQPKEEYFKAIISQIISEDTIEVSGFKTLTQIIGLTIQDGYEKGKDVVSQSSNDIKGSEVQKYRKGENVILQKTTLPSGQETYLIVDRYRLDAVLFILILFFASVILVAGKKGIGSILGMAFGLVVIAGFIAPLIVAGKDPLLVSITGALFIMVVSIYLAHGISKQTTSAIISTFLSLVFAGVLSYVFVAMTSLTGVGNEDSYGLQFGLASVDLKGLLLGGIIIGTLGILDDITTSQSAVVFEIAKTNNNLTFKELVLKGLNVGREHVASLVNTLVLVYAGVSLGLFIIFILNPTHQPYWVLLNYQSITEEAVRTLAGSIALTFAIPLSTIISAFTVKRFVHGVKKKDYLEKT